MGDFNRYLIRDGDTTTAGGTVIASGSHMPIDGLIVALEGDAVQCPACKSTGFIKCTPPIRKFTGHAGTQLSVDGDLCMCGCPTPPRLIASQKMHSIGFSASEIASTPAAAPWLAHAGLSLEPFGYVHDEQFQLLGANGKPLANRKYKAVSSSDSSVTGMTDSAGNTQRIKTPAADTLQLFLTS
jgi:uncharacterized Zn-binding protein involved in type VI secretion